MFLQNARAAAPGTVKAYSSKCYGQVFRKKKHKKFEGVAEIKRELGRYNLPAAQFNEALYLCRQHNAAWCTTDNWDSCNKTNNQTKWTLTRRAKRLWSAFTFACKFLFK